MQKFFAALLIAVLALFGVRWSASQRGKILEIQDSPATLEGVTVTLETAVARRCSDGTTYALQGSLKNNTDEGIMQITYTFSLLDASGEEFSSFDLVYDGEDTAIPAQGTIRFAHDEFDWEEQAIPAAVKVGIADVKTEAELPPAHVPKPGEYLYLALGDEKLANIKEEPPVELTLHVDHGGFGRYAVFREGDALQQAVDLLCGIQVGKETDEWVTDNYNGIWLTWEDGSQTCISLNLYNLECSIHSKIHLYDLNHLDAFWSYCEDYLESEQYE